MLRVLLFISILMPSISNAEQGLKISCLNMKDVIIGRKHDPLNFTMQAVGLEYLDKEKGEFVMIEANKLDIGDVFIKGGSPGHAVIVVDKCVGPEGEVRFMLAQSYMPAQDIQILVGDHKESPWYDLNFGEILNTPEFQFSKNDFKSF